MSALHGILNELQDTQAAIKQLEGLALKNPKASVITVNLESLYQRSNDLETEFSQIASDEHLDVCSYRLIAGHDEHYSVAALSKALGDFQSLFSIVYDSIKNNIKKLTAHVSPEVIAESSFVFGYTYAGSLGFVFTMPNERLLIGESHLDIAMSTVFEMARADSTDKISALAKQIGVAPIRSMYKWASDHLEYGLSADIKWRRNDEIRANLIVQPPELERLKMIIDETSDEEVTTFTIAGDLIGGDVETKRFHLKYQGEDITGKIADNFSATVDMSLKHTYRATIMKKVKIHYSMDKEDVSYFLMSLENP